MTRGTGDVLSGQAVVHEQSRSQSDRFIEPVFIQEHADLDRNPQIRDREAKRRQKSRCCELRGEHRSRGYGLDVVDRIRLTLHVIAAADPTREPDLVDEHNRRVCRDSGRDSGENCKSV